MKKPATAALATLFAVLGASSAFAQDYCVQDAACVTAGGTDQPTLAAALAASEASLATPDRVLIGPGTYTAPTTLGFVAKLSPVEIIGSGSGSTILTGPADTARVLDVRRQGSRVADLGIVIPANTTNATEVGLLVDAAVAEGLEITADPALSTVAIGVDVRNGAVLQDSAIDLLSVNANTAGMSITASTARGNYASARHAINVDGGDVHLDRNRARATGTGIWVVNSATGNDMTNSLVQITGNGSGVVVSTLNGTDAGIAIRNSTIVGDGTPGSFGVDIGSSNLHVASIDLDSSIVRGFPVSLRRGAVGGGSANFAVEYSDYSPFNVVAVGPGTTTLGPGNIAADPLFSGPSDFHLATGSPAIETGNPSSFGDAADLDGNTRVADADSDGVARRDMGAFEALPPAPANQPPPGDGGGDPASPDPGTAATSAPGPGSAPGGTAALADGVAPALTGLAITPRRFARKSGGARLRFQLSEQAVVRVVIRRRVSSSRMRTVTTLKRSLAGGRRSIRVGARIGSKILTPGYYTAVLTATDPTGNVSRPSRVRFRVA